MFELTDRQHRVLADLAQQYALDFVVLFGSQVTGLTHRASDLDLGYQAQRPLDYRAEYALCQALQTIFPAQPVQLVNLIGASPLLRKKALVEGRLLHERTPHGFSMAQMAAFGRYVEEALPLLKLARAR